jgi:riboflavin biosynthesis pyrimidine reductase
MLLLRAKTAIGNSDESRARDKSRCRQPAIDLRWLLKKLGAENMTSLLVEGGGEVNASFLLGGLAQRVAFFYAPKILGGRDSRKPSRAKAQKVWRGDSASRR